MLAYRISVHETHTQMHTQTQSQTHSHPFIFLSKNKEQEEAMLYSVTRKRIWHICSPQTIKRACASSLGLSETQPTQYTLNFQLACYFHSVKYKYGGNLELGIVFLGGGGGGGGGVVNQAEERKWGTVNTSSFLFFQQGCCLQTTNLSSFQLTRVWRHRNSWLRQSSVTKPDAKFSSQTLFPFQTKLRRTEVVVVFSGAKNTTFRCIVSLNTHTKPHVNVCQ